MMKKIKLINFFLGIFVMVIIVFFYGLFTSFDGLGAVSSFFGFAVISIICTAGVTLAIWIPALLLLGTIANKIFSFFFNQRRHQLLEKSMDKTVENATNINNFSNNEAAIIKYIIDSRQTNIMSDEVIRSNLKNSGWSDDEIGGAFNKCA
jgi:hypothetical protein